MQSMRILRAPRTPSWSPLIPPYAHLVKTLKAVRQRLLPADQPLTLAEKCIYAHLDSQFVEKPGQSLERGKTYLKLNPDRVAMQDASAQMALLQFMLCGRDTTAVPSSIHCDHLIRAYRGGDEDVATSVQSEREIYEFLESAANRYGIGFWKPGSGIIHQIVLENYAAPGGLMLGTDSHTPNAGGLGMIAIGVGGADAVDAMAAIPWELKAPKIIGVHLTGKLSGWTSPKDIILHLAGQLTVRGGTGSILEYFGEGIQSLSCTGMATICNMGAEVGATTSVFPYNDQMNRYLHATRRGFVADAADRVNSETGYLQADKGAKYDQIIEINLSELEPYLNGPFTPDHAIPLSKIKDVAAAKKWPTKIESALIGSCTNSSYEDMSRAASIAQQAIDKNVQAKSEFLVTPGSEQIRATVERDGQTEALTAIGGKVLANACGPCIGMWKRTENQGEDNVILTSFNRNFKGRNDGNAKTMNFLASPEIVTAMALAGSLNFNPITDSLKDANGKEFRLEPPTGHQLPDDGFAAGRSNYVPPPLNPPSDPSIKLSVDPSSSRLQLLEPFAKWHGDEFENMLVLVRVRGKCTTDHISAAGPWLKYKGHLDNIANNTLIGAVNDETGQVNCIKNQLTGEEGTIPDVARAYQRAQQPWLVVADSNYGEGSAREHAALQPRYLGCSVIVAKSFARIHETNLKKQGILPLVFENPDDYALLKDGVRVSTRGLVDLVRGGDSMSGSLSLVVRADGQSSDVVIPVRHTMSRDQLEWFKHGSALNMIRMTQSSSSTV